MTAIVVVCSYQCVEQALLSLDIFHNRCVAQLFSSTVL